MQTTLPVKKKKGVNKLVLGFAALVASAVIGTTGVAAAHSNNNHHKHNRPAGGYAANVNINNNINVGVSGNNNVITIIIRPIINIFR